MTASERFNDSEMEAFFDTEMKKQLSSMRTEHQDNIVADRLWAVIESLNMNLAIGRDPANHAKDFADLEETIGGIIDNSPPNDSPDYSRMQDIHALANEMWDEELIMIEQISLAMSMQLYGNIPDTDKAMIKKWLTARLMTEGDDQKRWIELTDAALEGDPLDLTDPEDFTILTEALEKKANLENTPEAQLHNSILALMGIPATAAEITDEFDFDQMEMMIYAARDITEAVLYNPKHSQQPERHSSIHEVLQEYCLVGEIDINTLQKLSDTYADAKAPKE